MSYREPSCQDAYDRAEQAEVKNRDLSRKVSFLEAELKANERSLEKANQKLSDPRRTYAKRGCVAAIGSALFLSAGAYSSGGLTAFFWVAGSICLVGGVAHLVVATT